MEDSVEDPFSAQVSQDCVPLAAVSSVSIRDFKISIQFFTATSLFCLSIGGGGFGGSGTGAGAGTGSAGPGGVSAAGVGISSAQNGGFGQGSGSGSAGTNFFTGQSFATGDGSGQSFGKK